MNLFQLYRHWIDGEPRLERRGNSARIKAAHRLPSSRDMGTSLYFLAVVATAALLISYYAPDMVSNPDENYLLAFAAYVVIGISNAFEALAEVARAEPRDVPLENLRGWMFALYWIGGTVLVMEFGPFQLFTWLANREHVTVTIDDETVSVRHRVLSFPKRIARETVEDVLILPNHRSGHDVMLQHEGGLTRLASVHGDLTRPTLIKCSVERALAEHTTVSVQPCN
ncbi:hypothetical protein [Oceanibium sediminis]|uniref:hypothetical protein n=1 Tax=Oceanibium sediminis TaxID=2026339 RepID=UPI001300A456|nr:hypothetical protein [Oceanibium sediminis]